MGTTPRLGRIPIGLLLILASAPLALVPVRAAEPLRLLSITPSGEDVPPARQIVLQFARPVVPVGRMERDPGEIPFLITPPLECEWRWLDPSALACQLTEAAALAPATRYTLRLAPGVRSLEGATLADPIDHSFLTERPRLLHQWFETWLAPGTPRIRLVFNQRVPRTQVEEVLRFVVEGEGTIGVESEFLDDETPDRERRWVIRPDRELPLDTAVELRIVPGLTSREGPEPGVEDRVAVAFDTFPEPRFLGLGCRDNGGHSVRIDVDGGDAGRRCNPMAGVSVRFAAPVIKDVLRDHLEVTPDLAGGRSDYDPWEPVPGGSRLSEPHRRGRDYAVWLPGPLRADAEYQLRASADRIRDEFDRPLVRDIDFRFRTDDRPPRAVLTHPVSVLEQGVETHVPLVVTNLEEVRADFAALTPGGLVQGTEVVPVEPARNVAFRMPLRVREWLGGPSGVLLGSIRPRPATPGISRWFFTQVTPFQVHAKVGHRNSLVWVTDLATGRPVAGASVHLYAGPVRKLVESPAPLATATTDAEGLARLDGIADLDPELERFQVWWSMLDEPSRGPRMFLRVEAGSGLAILPLSRDFSVRARGPNSSWIPTALRRRYGHVRTWGTTAQGVYRVGDTVHYKIYVRDQGNQRLVPAPRGGYTLEVIDPMDKVVHRRTGVELNAFGAFHGEFELPNSGAVGWYRFRLVPEFSDGLQWFPLRVLVADFTPAPFRVSTDLEGELWHPGDELHATTQASLHAGGPYVDAETRLTVTLRPAPLRPEDPRAQGFWFQTGHPGAETLHQSHGRVDEKGARGTSVTLPDSKIIHGRLLVESAVRDDRGKFVTGSATARYVGRDRFVGIRQEDWILRGGDASRVHALVVDEHGAVVEGVEVTTRIEVRETKASRVKGAGNAYLTRYVHSWLPFASCSERSGSDPTACSFTPDRPGLYRFTVEIRDAQGRPHESSLERWAVGRGRVLWEVPPGHELPVLPEKAEYRVGETARFLVQNPFPGGRALVTIERLGVLERWSRTLESSSEVVEFQVTRDHLPGFYLSVVVTSPRVERPAGDDPVDLGKPAFRMGYVRVPVRDPAKEILVEVRPRRPVYRPRETVEVELAARTREGETPPMELAVAVLDEAVFDLIADGRRTFDPYQGFYRLDALDLANFNLLTRLVGIQKFEKKGANPGGGGGMGPELRSLFRFVSYWNPSLPTDAVGKARITFQVPDNLTGWRVLALAVTPEDRMGLGEGTFQVNRPTEIRPALPNQLVEGDRFEARFTLMNRTEATRVLRVDAGVEGPASATGLAGERIEVEPYRRRVVSFPVRTLRAGEVRFTIRAGDEADADALVLPVPIHARQALDVAATYGTTTDAEASDALVFPEAIRTDLGRVSVVASPSVIGGIEGAFRYLRDYPYDCWEQRLSKAVMASHYAELRGYLPAPPPPDLAWEGHESLPEQMLRDAADFQAPNGGMAYWVPRDEYVSPYLSAYTALAFGWLRERGHEIPAPVEEKLHDYLGRLLRRDAFPSFYTQGMESSVRAVALAALAGAGRLQRSDLERYRRHVPRMDLFGRAHALLAALRVEGTEELRSEIRDAILAHANRSGGKFGFTEAVDTGFERILHTSLRSHCAILSAWVRGQAGAPGGVGVGDIPFKLTRAITQARGRRDHWENTQENVFCMNALVDFSRVYESQAPRYTVAAQLDDDPMGSARFEDVRNPAVVFERPIGPEDPGRHAAVKLTKQGPGRLYWATRLFTSPLELPSRPANAGIEVRREYSVERDGRWELLEDPVRIRAGELVRIDLYASLPAARNFVVIDDPVPGGLEPVNRDLATASRVDADKGEVPRAGASYWYSHDDWIPYASSRWSFYHRELRHDAARFFSDYLPAGNYHLSYVAQAIAPGEFQILPVHAEEMYDPDVFGRGVPATLRVESAE